MPIKQKGQTMKRMYIKFSVVLLFYIAGWMWLILDPVVLRAPALRNPCFILLVDCVPFLAGLLWLRPPRPIPFWKVTVYLVLIMGISVPLSMAPTDLVNTFYKACFALEWVLFAAVNAYLWEALFKVTIQRKWDVSIVIGFVNAALCILSVPVIK